MNSLFVCLYNSGKLNIPLLPLSSFLFKPSRNLMLVVVKLLFNTSLPLQPLLLLYIKLLLEETEHLRQLLPPALDISGNANLFLLKPGGVGGGECACEEADMIKLSTQ